MAKVISATVQGYGFAELPGQGSAPYASLQTTGSQNGPGSDTYMVFGVPEDQFPVQSSAIFTLEPIPGGWAFRSGQRS